MEAAEEWPDVFYVGADVSDSQLLGACDNLKAAGLAHRIELLKGSVADLPLPAQSVDVIISDIPFGKKFKLGKDIKSILQEMESVPVKVAVVEKGDRIPGWRGRPSWLCCRHRQEMPAYRGGSRRSAAR